MKMVKKKTVSINATIDLIQKYLIISLIISFIIYVLFV